MEVLTLPILGSYETGEKRQHVLSEGKTKQGLNGEAERQLHGVSILLWFAGGAH